MRDENMIERGRYKPTALRQVRSSIQRRVTNLNCSLLLDQKQMRAPRHIFPETEMGLISALGNRRAVK